MPREQYFNDSSTPNLDNLDKNNGSEENNDQKDADADQKDKLSKLKNLDEKSMLNGDNPANVDLIVKKMRSRLSLDSIIDGIQKDIICSTESKTISNERFDVSITCFCYFFAINARHTSSHLNLLSLIYKFYLGKLYRKSTVFANNSETSLW